MIDAVTAAVSPRCHPSSTRVLPASNPHVSEPHQPCLCFAFPNESPFLFPSPVAEAATGRAWWWGRPLRPSRVLSRRSRCQRVRGVLRLGWASPQITLISWGGSEGPAGAAWVLGGFSRREQRDGVGNAVINSPFPLQLGAAPWTAHVTSPPAPPSTSPSPAGERLIAIIVTTTHKLGLFCWS